MRAAGSTAVAVPVAMFAAASFWLSIKYLVKPGIWMTERVRPRLLDARRRGPRSRSRTLPAPMGMKTPGKIRGSRHKMAVIRVTIMSYSRNIISP